MNVENYISNVTTARTDISRALFFLPSARSFSSNRLLSERRGHQYPAALAHTHPRCRSRCLPVAATQFPRAVYEQAAGERFIRLNKTGKQANTVLHAIKYKVQWF